MNGVAIKEVSSEVLSPGVVNHRPLNKPRYCIFCCHKGLEQKRKCTKACAALQKWLDENVYDLRDFCLEMP